MKKTITLMLALMLVFAFGLVACGDEATDTEGDTATTAEATETTAEATETTATEEPSGPIEWTEAADYETQEVTITGPVVVVDNLFEIKGIAKMLVRLGGDSTQDHFNVTFALNQDGTWPDNLAEYAAMMDTLVGKTVEVTGVVRINSFESCFEILMNDADDNTLPDDVVSGTMVVK